MRNRRLGRGLMAAGLVCLIAALGLTGYNLWDGYRAERSAAAALGQIHAAMPDPEDSVSSAPAPSEETWALEGPLEPEEEPPTLTVDGQTYLGVLSIPALELELPILSDWSYPKLKQSPCWFQGAVREDGFIIIGHNYREHFGSLKELRQGDEVIFTDVEGDRYLYTVSTLEELGGGDLDALTSGGWPLTLVTCTWGGQSRVVVRCSRQRRRV